MDEYYLLIKALHIIFMISWMAGIFYLPRLFVYHAQTQVGSEADNTFKIMESRLIRIIINPAMILTFIFGMMLIYIIGFNVGKWLHIKLLLVLALAAHTGIMTKYKKDFEQGINQKSHVFFRLMNEIPPILMIIIVILAVTKPF